MILDDNDSKVCEMHHHSPESDNQWHPVQDERSSNRMRLDRNLQNNKTCDVDCNPCYLLQQKNEGLAENYRGLQGNGRSSTILAASAGSPEKHRVSKTPNTASRTHRNGVHKVSDPPVARQLEVARVHLSKFEADAIELALLMDVAS